MTKKPTLQLLIFSDKSSEEDTIDLLPTLHNRIHSVMKLDYPKNFGDIENYKANILNVSTQKLNQNINQNTSTVMVFRDNCPAYFAIELGQYYLYNPIKTIIAFESDDKFIECDLLVQSFRPEQSYLSQIQKIECNSESSKKDLIQITFCYSDDEASRSRVLKDVKTKYMFIFNRRINGVEYMQAKYEIFEGLREISRNHNPKFIITSKLETALNFAIGSCWRKNIYGELNFPKED